MSMSKIIKKSELKEIIRRHKVVFGDLEKSALENECSNSYPYKYGYAKGSFTTLLKDLERLLE